MVTVDLRVSSIHFDVYDDHVRSALAAILPHDAQQESALQLANTTFWSLDAAATLSDTISLRQCAKDASQSTDFAPRATAIFFRASSACLSRLVAALDKIDHQDISHVSIAHDNRLCHSDPSKVNVVSFRLRFLSQLLFVVQHHESKSIGHLDGDQDILNFVELCTTAALSPSEVASKIDHVAVAVEEGTAFRVTTTLQQLFGLRRLFCHGEDRGSPEKGLIVEQPQAGMRMFTLLSTSDDPQDLETSESGLTSHASDFYFAIVEPLRGKKGQVYDFVERHGANIQHIAFRTDDIVADAQRIRSLGRINLVRAHREAAEPSLAITSSDPIAFDQVLQRSSEGILVHARSHSKRSGGQQRDFISLLSQIFTAALHPQAEIFFEIIERKEYRGFAPANIGGLFRTKGETTSILYVDEMLGGEDVRAWAQDHARQGVNIDVLHLNCSTEGALVRFLQHTSRRFDVLVSSFVPISDNVLATFAPASLPKLIQAQGVGYNHIDLRACSQRNIAVANNADWCSAEVAEFCLAAVISRWTRQGAADFRTHGWARQPHYLERHSLSHARLLIVGCGLIGGHLASISSAVGIQVDVFDTRHPELHQRPLQSLVQDADFVSIHLPLDEGTTKLFDESLIGKMKPNSWLINTARGAIVDEAALLQAIEENRVAGATLDVFDQEPLTTDSNLLKVTQIKCTPHIAGLTIESESRACKGVTKNVDLLSRLGAAHCERLIVIPDLDSSVSGEGKASSESSHTGSYGSQSSTLASSHAGHSDTEGKPMHTMRDIFDSVNEERIKRNTRIFNLSAGMVEVEPCNELLHQAAISVMKPQCSSAEVPWLHMYRERKGDSELRHQLVKLHASGRYGPGKVNLSCDNFLICSGVSGVITSILSAWRTLNGYRRKPRIMLFVPYYTYHLEIANGIFGREGYELITVPMRIDSENGCTYDRNATERVLYEQGCGADICILTNPHNPSGHVLTEDEAQWLEGLVRRYKDTWFVSDDIYADMVYTSPDGIHRSLYVPEADNLFVAYGFSKSLAIGSWRVAYVIVSQNRFEMMAKEHDRFYISAPWTQHAIGQYLMKRPQAFDAFVTAWHRRLTYNTRVVGQAFEAALGWKAINAQAGMYLLLEHDQVDDWQAFQLALAKNIAVAPGCLFGLSPGFVRIHLAFSQAQADLVAASLLG